MKILLLDTHNRRKLFPLTSTRAVAGLRYGMFTIRERWERLTGLASDILTEEYLQEQYGNPASGEYMLIDSAVLPNPYLVEKILSLKTGFALADEKGLIAGRHFFSEIPQYKDDFLQHFTNIENENVERIELPCHLFQLNGQAINDDFRLYTAGKTSRQNLPDVISNNPSQVFIEESATIENCSLNATTGPIYIGRNALVMEGCLIRGPFVLGDGAVLKMGSKIYGATTLGPYCVGGGEIKNSIMMGYCNKAHDGYLGDSIIGEWCNLGAGTSNSNLKNNMGEVKVYNYHFKDYIPSGNKCGIVVGDYTRTSINTSFNTGTVVGIGCNVFGDGLTPKFIPDFTWGTKGLSRYEFEKALTDIKSWMKLKNVELNNAGIKMLKHIFDHYND